MSRNRDQTFIQVHTILLFLILIIILGFALYIRDIWSQVSTAGSQVLRSLSHLLPHLTHPSSVPVTYPALLPRTKGRFSRSVASFLARTLISSYNLHCDGDPCLPKGAKVHRIGNIGFLYTFPSQPSAIRVLSFRGSLEGEDFVADLDITQVSLEGASKGILVHRGMWSIWSSIWKEVEENLLRDSSPLYITGHSLGASLAAYSSSSLSKKPLPFKLYGTYLFGAPRAGNKVFTSSLDPSIWVLANRTDIVPTLPPTASSYFSGTYLYGDYDQVYWFEIEKGSLVENHSILTYLEALEAPLPLRRLEVASEAQLVSRFPSKSSHSF